MIPKFLSRYARQVAGKDQNSQDSQDDDDSSEYVTKIEFLGTSTVEIKKSTNFQTTTAYVLQQSKNNLQKIETSIDDLSKKTQGEFKLFHYFKKK
jgi:hypothetical protein